jgi:hypothetical protein
MKLIIANFLLFLYFTVLVKPILPYIEYSIFTSAIISKKCENTDKPKMQCNGKCFLVKQIKKILSEENSQPNPKPKPIKTETKIDFLVPFFKCCSKINYSTLQSLKYPLFAELFISNYCSIPPTPPPKTVLF